MGDDQSAIRRWNCSLVHWLPWSLRCSRLSGLPLFQIVMISGLSPHPDNKLTSK